MAQNKTLSGVIDYSSWGEGEHTVDFWVINDALARSKTVTVTVTIEDNKITSVKYADGKEVTLQSKNAALPVLTIIDDPLTVTDGRISVPGSVKDAAKAANTVYYKIVSKPVDSTGAPNAEEQFFQLAYSDLSTDTITFGSAIDASGWSNGSYTLQFYSKNANGLTSNVVERTVTIHNTVTVPNVPSPGGSSSDDAFWYSEPEEASLSVPASLPQTGDSSTPALFIALMLFSGSAVVLLSHKRRHS